MLTGVIKMDYVLHYTPTIEKMARKFYVSSEHKEDLVQEGLLKLYKLHNMCTSKNEDFYSKDWQKIIMRSVKNCMIDHIRKLTRRSKELFSEDFLFPDDSVQFELTQIRLCFDVYVGVIQKAYKILQEDRCQRI
jgi:RNA polymerase sigma factor (sigma-70 family)